MTVFVGLVGVRLVFFVALWRSELGVERRIPHAGRAGGDRVAALWRLFQGLDEDGMPAAPEIKTRPSPE